MSKPQENKSDYDNNNLIVDIKFHDNPLINIYKNQAYNLDKNIFLITDSDINEGITRDMAINNKKLKTSNQMHIIHDDNDFVDRRSSSVKSSEILISRVKDKKNRIAKSTNGLETTNGIPFFNNEILKRNLYNENIDNDNHKYLNDSSILAYSHKLNPLFNHNQIMGKSMGSNMPKKLFLNLDLPIKNAEIIPPKKVTALSLKKDDTMSYNNGIIQSINAQNNQRKKHINTIRTYKIKMPANIPDSIAIPSGVISTVNKLPKKIKDAQDNAKINLINNADNPTHKSKSVEPSQKLDQPMLDLRATEQSLTKSPLERKIQKELIGKTGGIISQFQIPDVKLWEIGNKPCLNIIEGKILIEDQNKRIQHDQKNQSHTALTSALQTNLITKHISESRGKYNDNQDKIEEDESAKITLKLLKRINQLHLSKIRAKMAFLEKQNNKKESKKLRKFGHPLLKSSGISAHHANQNESPLVNLPWTMKKSDMMHEFLNEINIEQNHYHDGEGFKPLLSPLRLIDEFNSEPKFGFICNAIQNFDSMVPEFLDPKNLPIKANFTNQKCFRINSRRETSSSLNNRFMSTKTSYINHHLDTKVASQAGRELRRFNFRSESSRKPTKIPITPILIEFSKEYQPQHILYTSPSEQENKIHKSHSSSTLSRNCPNVHNANNFKLSSTQKIDEQSKPLIEIRNKRQCMSMSPQEKGLRYQLSRRNIENVTGLKKAGSMNLASSCRMKNKDDDLILLMNQYVPAMHNQQPNFLVLSFYETILKD